MGVLGLCYFFWGGVLFAFNRVGLDRVLVSGHFLSKVVALVLLMPFSLELIIRVCDSKLTPAQLLGEQMSTNPSLFWPVYYHFVNPGYQHLAAMEHGRPWSGLIAVFGVFLLNGLLVSSIIGWIDRRKERWLNGEVRYPKWFLHHNGGTAYAVVIGANEMTVSVIKKLLGSIRTDEVDGDCGCNNVYVILQTSRNVNDVRLELASHLSELELRKVVIYNALRDSESEMRKLYVDSCSEIYILGELTAGREVSYSDALNMRCVNLLAKILKENEREKLLPKKVHVLFEAQTTYSIYKQLNASQVFGDNIIFIPFNKYELFAREVMADKTLISSMPLKAMTVMENDDSYVHFIVVGMSKVGIAMGGQALLQTLPVGCVKSESGCESNNCVASKNKSRHRVTFIDANADARKEFLMGYYAKFFKQVRYRYIDAQCCSLEMLRYDSSVKWIEPVENAKSSCEQLSELNEDIADVEVEFIKGEFDSHVIREYLKNVSDIADNSVRNSRLIIAICFPQEDQAIEAGLYMPDSVYDKAQEIWVYQRETADVILNFSRSERHPQFAKLRPFGMLYRGC